MEFQESLRKPHLTPSLTRDPTKLQADRQPTMRQFIHISARPGPAQLARREHLKHSGIRMDISSEDIDSDEYGEEIFQTFNDPAYSSMTELSMADNPLKDKGAVELMRALGSHASLTDLHLESCSIADIGAATISLALAVDPPAELPNADRPSPFAFSPLPPPPPGEGNIFGNRLRMLWLNNNLIEDEGARAIALALSYNTNLTELYLGFNRIADDGAVELARMISVYNTSLRVLHLWRNPFGESAEKGIGEGPGYLAIRHAISVNTSLTSYDGPAGPLLNGAIRQDNRNAFLRQQSIKDADAVLEIQDQMRGKDNIIAGLQQDIVNLKLWFEKRQLELEDEFQDRLRIRQEELEELHKQDLAHMKAKCDQLQIEALEFQEEAISAALKRQLKLSLDEQERRLEEDFAIYLKKREQALETRNKMTATQLEQEFKSEMLAIRSRHDAEVKKLVDDAACL